MSPLPHHRAYGSVPRRFGGLSTRQFLHWRQSETTETGFGEAAVTSLLSNWPPKRAMGHWSGSAITPLRHPVNG